MPAIEVPADAAGERLDVFLAGHAGSRAAAQRLIDDGRVRVDGEEKAKRHTPARGRDDRGRGGRGGGRPRRARRALLDRVGGRAPDGGRQARGVVVHPARGHAAGTLAQALERVGAAGGPEGAARDRPPARPRHERAARGRALGRGPEGAAERAAAARDRARVPRARRRSPRRAHRHDRGAAGPRPPRAHPHVDRHRRGPGRDHPLRDRAGPATATRCCGCGSRPAARTRSAPT